MHGSPIKPNCASADAPMIFPKIAVLVQLKIIFLHHFNIKINFDFEIVPRYPNCPITSQQMESF